MEKYINTLSTNEQVKEILLILMAKILSKQDNQDAELFVLFMKMIEPKILHIRDWITAVIENNEQWKEPRVLTIDALNNAADKYFEKQNNKIQTIKLDKTYEKLIADLGDYYVVQMLTPEALDNESKQMQHCIGHGYYDQKLNKEEYKYLSLRDKFNKAHITIEIHNNEIRQLQGKQNKVPDQKYLEILLPWLINNNYKLLNLSRYDLVLNKNDNKIYSVYNIPDNCEIDGNLCFRDNYEIKKIPKNLVVNGVFHIFNCPNLIEISDNLIVNGTFDASFSNIEQIPYNVKISRNIYLRQSKIKKFYIDYVDGDIELSDSYIEEFSNNLTITGSLNLSGCKHLKKMPDNLTVNGLYLINTMINEMPKNLNCHLLAINQKDIALINENLNFEKIKIFFDDTREIVYLREKFFEDQNLLKEIYLKKI